MCRLDLAPGTPIVLTKDHWRAVEWGGPILAGTKGEVAPQVNRGRGYKLGAPHTLLTLYDVTIMQHGQRVVVARKDYFVEDSTFTEYLSC